MVAIGSAAAGISATPVVVVGFLNGPADTDLTIRSGFGVITGTAPVFLALTIEDASDNVIFVVPSSPVAFAFHAGTTSTLAVSVLETVVSIGSLVHWATQMGFGAPDHFALRGGLSGAAAWTAQLGLEII